VINDVIFLILLVAMTTWKSKTKVIDIEIAFLYGDLKETIYIEIPKGMKAERDECLMLNKTIYGLVQSARKFHKKIVFALKDVDTKWVLLIPVFGLSILLRLIKGLTG
jgi:hypothetical protein